MYKLKPYWNTTILARLKKRKNDAQAGVTQWIECWSENWKVANSIPGQGTCLGCGPGSQLGGCERQLINLTHVSLPLSPSLPLSLKINKNKSFKKLIMLSSQVSQSTGESPASAKWEARGWWWFSHWAFQKLARSLYRKKAPPLQYQIENGTRGRQVHVP